MPVSTGAVTEEAACKASMPDLLVTFVLPIVDKDGKEQKLPNRSSKENLKENPIDVIPEVEVTEHEGLEVCEIDIEAEKIDEEIKENEKKERVDALWMEYDDFCRCFRLVFDLKECF